MAEDSGIRPRKVFGGLGKCRKEGEKTALALGPQR